jgi:hypothetical protein
MGKVVKGILRAELCGDIRELDADMSRSVYHGAEVEVRDIK